MHSTKFPRRHDVDWLRVLALSLLIIYHIAIIFQPWAAGIDFPNNSDSLEWLWIIMSAINVWRIPILFMVSGMGIYFAMQRRTWRELLGERAFRILVPYAFGWFAIGPINALLVQLFFDLDLSYVATPSHLWFLANVFVYSALLLPVLYYFKNNPENRFATFLQRIFKQQPMSLYIFAIPLILATVVVNPGEYVLYAGTLHGWIFGAACFLIGFLFVSQRETFWNAVKKVKVLSLGIAITLYAVRLLLFEPQGINPVTAIETLFWILAILGFGASYINKPSRVLKYLNESVFPVYILHLPFTFLFALFILPAPMPAVIKLPIMVFGTIGACLITYEVVKRVIPIRPLFGMRLFPSRKIPRSNINLTDTTR